MKSIRDERVGFDTNTLIFGLLRDPAFPAAIQLLRNETRALKIYLCDEVLAELSRNLSDQQINELFAILNEAGTAIIDYTPAAQQMVEKYQSLGCKKGDAVIAAHLEAAGIKWFVSENRHFLAEISDLPFEVLSSQQAVDRLT